MILYFEGKVSMRIISYSDENRPSVRKSWPRFDELWRSFPFGLPRLAWVRCDCQLTWTRR